MTLLHRIARSSGDPQRTITALRLINERLESELRQYSACTKASLYQADLAAHSHQLESQQLAAYWGAIAEELSGDCGAVEMRREHLEAIVRSTTNLLQVIVKDLESPYLQSVSSAVVARLRPVAALLETALANSPNLDE